MTNKKKTRRDIYQEVTDSILEQLEQGVRPWVNPWVGVKELGTVLLPERHTGENYSGINIIMLWSKAFNQGYLSPRWMTFRQAQTLGGMVRRGERSACVFYAGKLNKKEVDPETLEENEESFFFMKAYSVFNAEQIEGLPEKYYKDIENVINPDERIEKAEQFFKQVGAEVRSVGNRAYYVPTEDYINMPRFEAFRSASKYVAVLAHEAIHWTRHQSRLNRLTFKGGQDSDRYAQEELVAEIGSAFLCAKLGINPEVEEEHAPYIENWLQALRHDKRFIFSAARHAQKAVDYLLELGGLKEKTELTLKSS